jgi:hypothetical protein
MRLDQNSCGSTFADSCSSDGGFVIVLIALDAYPSFIARGWEYILESSGLL